MKVSSIEEFVQQCKNKSCDEIYDLFENNTTEQVRDSIYEFAPEDVNEPARYAFRLLGNNRNIESLKNY